MSEMVERVAAAIAAVEIPADTPVPIYEWYARAAIEAMREPTEAMLLARNDGFDGSSVIQMRREYRAMIDAALNHKAPA